MAIFLGTCRGSVDARYRGIAALDLWLQKFARDALGDLRAPTIRLPTGSRQLLLFASLTVIASTVTLYVFYSCRLIGIGPPPSVLLRVVNLCNPTSHTNGERSSPHTSNRGSGTFSPSLTLTAPHTNKKLSHTHREFTVLRCTEFVRACTRMTAPQLFCLFRSHGLLDWSTLSLSGNKNTHLTFVCFISHS